MSVEKTSNINILENVYLVIQTEKNCQMSGNGVKNVWIFILNFLLGNKCQFKCGRLHYQGEECSTGDDGKSVGKHQHCSRQTKSPLQAKEQKKCSIQNWTKSPEVQREGQSEERGQPGKEFL